jgi:transcriptional regulator with XRE-family HTH domain
MPKRTRPEQLSLRRSLALNARAARGRLGWTQEYAAEKIGCSLQGLRKLERAAGRVTIDFVALMARAYKLDPQTLLSRAGPWDSPQPGRPASPKQEKKRR